MNEKPKAKKRKRHKKRKPLIGLQWFNPDAIGQPAINPDREKKESDY